MSFINIGDMIVRGHEKIAGDYTCPGARGQVVALEIIDDDEKIWILWEGKCSAERWTRYWLNTNPESYSQNVLIVKSMKSDWDTDFEFN